MKKELENLIKEFLKGKKFTLTHPEFFEKGDYAVFVEDPAGLQGFLLANNLPGIERIETVRRMTGGFVNIYLSKDFFKKSLEKIIDKGDTFGKGKHAKGFKVMVEHTDPNPFKEFHIGHLMPNVIGSAVARICEWNGAEVKQANYQGDKGLHVAKAVWARLKNLEQYSNKSSGGIVPMFEYGKAYAAGNAVYESDEFAKSEIIKINKKIYEMDDSKTYSSDTPEGQYQEGRKRSLEYFENIYKKLGSKFDFYFFESETAPIGKRIVEENVGKVFEESEGAIVFRGSHTRVFINSQGIPTYEAKDLGNAKNKYDTWAYDLSVVVTGNEIKDYFRVVLEAMGKVLPELAKKTKHIPHGMLRLPEGKMSSRFGNVYPAEELIEKVKERVKGDEQVAIAAIKYMILRQSIGNDVVFDFEKSVSTEGDSGVYLQYAHARANSILEKAGKKGNTEGERTTTHEIERLLGRFPEIVERAGAEYAPNYITTYLTELAASFNNFYAHEQVLPSIELGTSDNSEFAYRLAIVEAFKIVMKNGLNILGIPAPERM